MLSYGSLEVNLEMKYHGSLAPLIRLSGHLVSHLLQNPYPYSMALPNLSSVTLRSTTLSPVDDTSPTCTCPLTHFFTGVGSLGGGGGVVYTTGGFGSSGKMGVNAPPQSCNLTCPTFPLNAG